jgi:hypothetical protein
MSRAGQCSTFADVPARREHRDFWDKWNTGHAMVGQNVLTAAREMQRFMIRSPVPGALGSSKHVDLNPAQDSLNIFRGPLRQNTLL